MNIMSGRKPRFRVPRGLPILASVVALALFAGLAAGFGKIAYVAPVLALLCVPFLSQAGLKVRFWVLLALPFIVLIQVPAFHLPSGITPITLLLLGLAGAEIINPSCRRLPREGGWGQLGTLPLGLFALGGLLTALSSAGHDIRSWYITGLVVLLLFVLGRRLISNPDMASALLKSIFLALLLYLSLIYVANLTGHVPALTPNDLDWRWLGNGQTIQLGPIEYRNQWSVTVATCAGLEIPLGLAFLVHGKQRLIERGAALAGLVAASLLIAATAVRGAAIASAAAGIIVLLLSVRDRPVSAAILTLTVAVALFFYWDVMISMLPQPALQRFAELRGNLADVSNMRYRLDILDLTLHNIAARPLGYGYSYLWNQYRLDESIVYSAVLNGSGVIGAFGYLLAMVQFGWRYLTSFFRLGKAGSQQRMLVAIGVGVWLYGILAGFASQTLLVDPVHSFMFWAIIMATYHGIATAPAHGER